MLSSDDLSMQWLGHLGPNMDFPREVAHSPHNGKYFARPLVHDVDEYLDVISKNFFDSNLYAALYSSRQRELSAYDKVVIDLDSTDGRLMGAYKLMKLVVEHGRKLYGEPTVYCTGGKGFHVIYYFPEVEINPVTLRRWAISFVHEAVFNHEPIKKAGDEGAEIGSLMLKQLDTSVLGDKMQVTRLPYTCNFLKSGGYRYCCPINPDWTLDMIKAECEAPEYSLSWKSHLIIAEELVNIDAVIDKKLETQISFKGNNKRYESELLMLYKNAGMFTDGRRRMLSFLIIPRLVEIGEGKYEVKKFCYDFLKRSGKNPENYNTLIEYSYMRTIEGPKGSSDRWRPWSLKKFFTRFSSLYPSIIAPDDLQESKP